MLRKLVQLDAVTTLEELRAAPGNRLDKLNGDRAGRYSIRVDDLWRICFCWKDGAPQDVGIVVNH